MMKKMILMVAAVLMTSTAANAQSAIELAKQQKELNDINRKMLNQKPTKDAKKQAKELKKEGWLVPAGELSIEQQLTKSQLMGEELMADENGAPTKRFIMQTGLQTSGSYNAGYAAARTAAMTELASLLKTGIVSAFRQKLDNNYQVQVRLAFDKKELAARLKRNMQKELEKEGDEELNGIVDEVLSNKF